jgi:hypothetical protein
VELKNKRRHDRDNQPLMNRRPIIIVQERMSATMRTAGLALFAASTLAQSQYGENHVKVNLDSQIVEQTAFPAPNVTLLSPAFQPAANASFDPGWSTGTEGATGEDELSMRTCQNL